MSKTFTKLGAALDRESFEWLQRENPAIADAVEAEVVAGADPESIRNYMLKHIGEDRRALVARCVSAARYLAST